MNYPMLVAYLLYIRTYRERKEFNLYYQNQTNKLKTIDLPEQLQE